MKKIITLFIFVVLLASFASAEYTGAKLVRESTGEVVNLNYETYTNSYGDQGGRNPNIVLRLYSDNPYQDFKNTYIAAVVYSDIKHKNFVILQNVEHEVSFDDSGINYETVGDYIDTDLDFSTSQANMPGFIYAVVSTDDGIIESSDTFIPINPLDSWIVGVDGGLPCRNFDKLWSISDSCNIEENADQKYDSFDLSIEKTTTGVKVNVQKAYWLSQQGYAIEITRNGEFVVEAVDAKSGVYLDSKIAKLDEYLTLSTGKSEKINILVNGIKTAQFDLPTQTQYSQTETKKSGSGSTPSTTFNSKLEYEFKNIPELNKVIVYLKSPIVAPYFKITPLDSEIANLGLVGVLKNFYEINTNIVNFDSVTLFFKLERSWLRERNLDKDEVFVYSDKAKIKLTPQIISEDPDSIDFFVNLEQLNDFTIGNLDKVQVLPLPTPQGSVVAKPEIPKLEIPLNLSTPNVLSLFLFLITLILASTVYVLFKVKSK